MLPHFWRPLHRWNARVLGVEGKERLKTRCLSCWSGRLLNLRRAAPDCEDAQNVPAVGVLGSGGMEVKGAGVEEEVRTPRRENCSYCGSGRGFPLLLLSPGSEKEFPILFILVCISPLPSLPLPRPHVSRRGKGRGETSLW